MFGDVVVVVWYGFLSDSRWFAMRMVVDLGVLMGLVVSWWFARFMMRQKL